MRSTTFLIIATGALGLFGTGALFFERGADPVIYPYQDIPIFIPHDLHVREADEASGVSGAGIDCDFCHEDIDESDKSSDRNIPGHDVCENCHDDWIGEEDEPAAVSDCARCHTDLSATETSTQAKRMTLLPPNIIFPHSTHIEAELVCTDCHKNVPNKTVATRDDLPTMDRCLSCHQEKNAPTACTTCHLSTPDGRIVSSYPEGKLKPARYHIEAIHDGDFLRDHAVPAQRDEAYCKSCHDQKDCLDCHDGVARDARYHPGDWISTHYIRAKRDDFRCQSCHRFQTFCINCHIQSGVAAVSAVNTMSSADVVRGTVRRNPADMTRPAGPHPMAEDGWLDRASRNFHGFHAQRNIRACASCHQEQYCATCHGSGAAGGSGLNPHGPNAARLRGSTLSKRNARACLKCHSPADPSWR